MCVKRECFFEKEYNLLQLLQKLEWLLVTYLAFPTIFLFIPSMNRALFQVKESGKW